MIPSAIVIMVCCVGILFCAMLARERRLLREERAMLREERAVVRDKEQQLSQEIDEITQYRELLASYESELARMCVSFANGNVIVTTDMDEAIEYTHTLDEDVAQWALRQLNEPDEDDITHYE